MYMYVIVFMHLRRTKNSTVVSSFCGNHEVGPTCQSMVLWLACWAVKRNVGSSIFRQARNRRRILFLRRALGNLSIMSRLKVGGL